MLLKDFNWFETLIKCYILIFFHQNICDFLDFSFPAAIEIEQDFQKFTQTMSRRIYRMCTDLGMWVEQTQ